MNQIFATILKLAATDISILLVKKNVGWRSRLAGSLFAENDRCVVRDRAKSCSAAWCLATQSYESLIGTILRAKWLSEAIDPVGREVDGRRSVRREICDNPRSGRGQGQAEMTVAECIDSIRRLW